MSGNLVFGTQIDQSLQFVLLINLIIYALTNYRFKHNKFNKWVKTKTNIKEIIL